MIRTCYKCKIEKPITDFGKHKKEKDGIRKTCKPCNTQQALKWNKANPEKAKAARKKWDTKNTDYMKLKDKEWREANKEYLKEQNIKWRQDNKEYIKQKHKQWKNENAEYNREYHRLYKFNRLKTDFLFRLQANIRARIRNVFNGKCKSKRSLDILGCSIEHLKLHLEAKFKPGMTWGNYGYYGWHIDHIIPLCRAKTEEEIYKLCHYTNLQPLWAEENLKKNRF